MDWKRETAERLKEYSLRKSSIARQEEEIRRLKDAITRIRSSASDGTPVHGTGAVSRDDMLVNNIAARSELQASVTDTKRWLKTMDSALNELTEEERLVLDRFYINRQKGGLDRLCEELGVAELSSIYRKKDKALRKLTLLLYGHTET
jgi:DNA-directed RNA polymerase sigma subunit (sigma70/sigma32)